ncbi:hypothetical protein HMPREF0511_0566 [Limosilactobacillus fermentum ATCC 14931]|nr:hypothetical protein HMPREF0511_0566 [Limosilactobacillus fermentum ATCC 14931]
MFVNFGLFPLTYPQRWVNQYNALFTTHILLQSPGSNLKQSTSLFN